MSEWPPSRTCRTTSIKSDSDPAPGFREKQVVKKDALPKNIKVFAYSGYKADERPTAFVVDDRRYDVTRIIDRWYGVDHDYFKALADDGRIYLLKWDRTADLWFLVEVMEKEGKH
jgi:hypothetical protein